MEKLLLIDGNSIFNRAFYGMSANMLVTKDGFFTNAIYGFINILDKYLKEDNPTHVAIAFDLKGKTFRHDIYDKYKAGRKGMPPELASQLPVLKEILNAMNISILGKEGYEADDILGTLVSRNENSDMKTVVLTGDRDMLQLVSDKCTVKIPTVTSGQKAVNVFDLDTFLAEYTVTPKQFIDVKALMGDKSDNIPGVAGIGRVGALSLIKEFGSIENIYLNIDKVSKVALKTKLEQGKEDAFLSKTLATIKTDVPIEDLSIDELKIKKIDNKTLLEIFNRLEFNSFIEKFNLEQMERQDDQDAKDALESKYKFVESLNDDSFSGKPVYLQYDITDLYLDITVMTDDFSVLNAQADKAKKLLSDIFKNSSSVISHYIKDLFVYCMQNGLSLPKKYFDTATALYLFDSTRDRYDLDDTYRNINPDYNLEDAQVYKIHYIYEYTLNELEKTEISDLLYNVELPLVEVLAYMESIGIKADRDYLLTLSDYFANEINDTAYRIFDLAGTTFNINSPKQLGHVLFDQLGLPKSKTGASGNYSTSADVLEKLKHYPIVDKILYYRTVSKLHSTYAQGLLSSIASDGRIHSKFKQTVTATGRISSTDPNLQNIPVRTEMGRKIRKAFIPEQRFILISGDYSQIELRVLAHIAQDKHMIQAFQNKQDIHTTTASKVFNVPVELVTTQQRQAAKAVNFGIVYGISDFSLAQDIDVSVASARQYIDEYLNFFEDIKMYMDYIVKSAIDKGYVETMYKRRRYIPELSSPKYSIREFGKRVALNAPIQGSAADIMKIAMVNVYDRLKKDKMKSRLILQVHDELIIEAHVDEADKICEILEQYMKDYFNLSVPLDVEISKQNSLLKD